MKNIAAGFCMGGVYASLCGWGTSLVAVLFLRTWGVECARLSASITMPSLSIAQCSTYAWSITLFGAIFGGWLLSPRMTRKTVDR